ncbi:MAG: type II toxin-antitoxin system VapC family toxin [Candidatus Hydrothermarchaeota archaeon]|nr:MAG: type II toxin-antitoxin system VapC family toxin [Candidatus Hydrothermarchaeota archaeon]
MDEGVLIDTDVLIDYVKGKQELPPLQLYLSEITLYEFIRGTKDIAKAKSILEDCFVIIFHDNSIIKKASEIWVSLKNKGEILDDRDIMIASTAIAKKLPLLTRNKKHYNRLEKFGLVLYYS